MMPLPLPHFPLLPQRKIDWRKALSVLWIVLVSALAGRVCAAPEPVKFGEALTTRTLVNVRFETPAAIQMEVWLDGKRLGFAPFTEKVAVGNHYLTAITEGIQPVMQSLTVGAKGDQMVILPTAPLTAESVPDVLKQVIRTIETTHPNNHLTIIGMHVTPAPDDFHTLLSRIDQQLPGDPVVDVLRGRRLMKEQKLDEALAATDRALRKLPRVAHAWRVRAEVLLASGDAKSALEAANEAVLLEPQYYRNVQVRAQIHRALDNPTAAKNDVAMADKLYDELAKLDYGPPKAPAQAPK
ncbi:MAG TPA: tetratricopeptide repeat protein [Candidatus Sumerlaeota bacterium]|nr:tetratricopeptide repeat protein [Candidatus Sumerlaeota bacterium]HNM45668.1 tetratricopeptide repeat protein [Candidatus Sumerlaeota bacterium]